MDAQSARKEILGRQMKEWWGANKQTWGSQKNLAAHLGIGRSTLGDLIRGVRLPSPETAKKIYEVTHLDSLRPKLASDVPMLLIQNTLQDHTGADESGNLDRQSPQRNVRTRPAPDKPTPNTSAQTPESRQVSSQSTSAERQELFVPIFGFVWLYPEELRVLDHPAVQRLGRVNQLGFSYLVYRGATHTRLEHSIGTVHIAQRMINAIQHTADKARARGKRCGVAVQQPCEQRFIRLGALLHDIGHVVSGHTLEDQMCLTCKHDSDERLDALFTDTEEIWRDRDGLSLGQLIDQEFQKYLPKELAEGKVVPSDVTRLLIRKRPEQGKDRFLDQQQILERSSSIRLNLCRDIIGNTICADLLDYLHRDWYHIGRARTFDDRILQYMEIWPSEKPVSNQNPVPKPTDKFVVCLGESPRIRTDAVTQILDLLEWRYQLAETVLFHRTKLAAEAMLDRALYDLWGSDGDSAQRVLLGTSEDELFRVCKELAGKKKGDGSISAQLLSALEKRQIFTSLCTLSYYDVRADIRRRIRKHYAPDSERTAHAAHRNQILRVLEGDFVLRPGSLAMFCPGGSMKAKVADVVVTIEDEAHRLSAYEDETHDLLSAGHLTAQIRRFARLWRVHFFIDETEWRRIGEPIGLLLKQAVVKLALGALETYEKDSPEAIAKSIAKALTTIESSPWYRRVVKDEVIAAAYSGAETATGMYPFGAPSIRSCMQDEPS